MNKIPDITFVNSDDGKEFELINLGTFLTKLHTFKDHNPTLPHRISFFALLIVTEGEGQHQIDLKEYKIKKGTVLKLAKGQVHAFQKDAKYEGYLFLFTEDFVMNYFSKSTTNLISHLYNYHLNSPIASNELISTSFISQLNKELENKETYAQNNIVAAILIIYLLRLERKMKASAQQLNAKNYESFIQFKNLVESNYTKTRNVKDYANEMRISTKQLNHIVREFTINTAKSFIDDYVILEAKRELISTNKSIKEIAYSIGFDEVTNYTKFFKKKASYTPKEFRLKQTL